MLAHYFFDIVINGSVSKNIILLITNIYLSQKILPVIVTLVPTMLSASVVLFNVSITINYSLYLNLCGTIQISRAKSLIVNSDIKFLNYYLK